MLYFVSGCKNCFHVVRRAPGCLDRVRLFFVRSGVSSFSCSGCSRCSS